MSHSPPSVILIGQPNCGKSTLFNALAGLKAETSNFPGTTVKHAHSVVNIEGRLLQVIDLPGTYSLNPCEPAEKVALTHLFKEKPDLIINVVDASVLSRSLELTLELLELEQPMIVALNMIDLAEKKGVQVDLAALEKALGIRVMPTIATHGRGLKELLVAAFGCLDKPSPVRAPRWSADIEEKVGALAGALTPEFCVFGNCRFTAIKWLEADKSFCADVLGESDAPLKDMIDQAKVAIERERRAPAYEVISAERHHLALKIFEGTSRVRRAGGLSWDKRLDDVLMHPVLGYPILAAVFLGFFFLIFKIGGPLETLLLRPFSHARGDLASVLGTGLAFHLADGLLQGIGGGFAIVLPYFLPLLILMSFLEDLGYLARVGFLLDTFMHRIGLHGKSVSPFILGFGCNVPAIVSTRILESRRDRVITSLLIPFIPCSARSTIILALVAFFLGPWYALGFYFFNILVVAGVGRLLTLFSREPSPGLILEIPSLKVPSLRNILRKTYLQLKSFVEFAWPLLVAGSVVLSLLQLCGWDHVLNAVLSPFVVHGLGLPRELGITLVFGFLRKELSLVMMLQALGVGYRDLLTVISRQQILVFAVFVSFFIPCLSTFAMLWKEMGRRVAFLSAALSVTAAVFLSLLVRLVF
jgi:ferrous iron transport protein B